MKKSLILLSTAMILSLAACGEHTHTFASEWTHDETNHWHAATCEHTNEKSGLAAHTIGADGKCSVCDYQTQVEVDFDTFKSKTLNLPASPYDLVSTHYRSNGHQGSYQIDIDKNLP